jgi:hypothetical protein
MGKIAKRRVTDEDKDCKTRQCLASKFAGKAASPKTRKSVGTKAADDDYVMWVPTSRGTFGVTVRCDKPPADYMLAKAIEHMDVWQGQDLFLTDDHKLGHFRHLANKQEGHTFRDEAKLSVLATGRWLIPTKGTSAVIEVSDPNKWNVYHVDTSGQITLNEFERALVYGKYSNGDYAAHPNTWGIKHGQTDHLTLSTFGRGGTFRAEEDESGRLVLHSVMAEKLQSELDKEHDFWDQVYAATKFLKEHHVWLKSCMCIDDSMDTLDDLERLTTGLAIMYDWDQMTPHPWYFEYCEVRKILEDLSKSRPTE